MNFFPQYSINHGKYEHFSAYGNASIIKLKEQKCSPYPFQIIKCDQC